MKTATAPSKALTERQLAALDAEFLRDMVVLRADVASAAKAVTDAQAAMKDARRRQGDALAARSRRSLALDRAKRQALAK